jgi:hypothetical protein
VDWVYHSFTPESVVPTADDVQNWQETEGVRDISKTAIARVPIRSACLQGWFALPILHGRVGFANGLGRDSSPVDLRMVTPL